jgi:dynein heavy chain, axonemal
LGVGGSGRQSLSRLASYICNYKMFQIEVVKGYNMSNWREDVKKVLLQCGYDNKQTTFLFCDTQIINEQMLEDLNGILNSADVPNLYKKEDFEIIMEVGEKECMSRGIAPTTMNRFSSYVKRVKSNIHMVIAMSPLGEVFRNRIRKFPSLVNCCTLDWFTEWPEEALREVATGDMTESELQLGENLKDCVELFVYMHQTVEEKSKQFLNELRRYNYVTPTSYLELLNVYRSVFMSKQKEITYLKERLNKGLKVLADASVEIDKLKDMLDKKQPELEKTKAEVAETKEQLASDKADADEERAVVAEQEASASEQEAEANALKEAAEAELAKAAPLLDEATRVLKELKVDDFYILGSFNSPPATVVIGMELSCVMMGLKPKKNLPKKAPNDTAGFFDCAKSSLLNKPKEFRQKMIDYDKDNIPESIVKRASVILESPEFTLEKVKNASSALVAIHKWVSAMISYHELLKIVNPKREKVAEMKEQLAIVSADLAEKRQKLKEVDDRIEELERMFREKVNQEEALAKEIEECNKKLERAGKLISGLQGEKIRWTNTVKQYEAEYGLLVGNCLVAAGMVAYAGPFTSQYRSELEDLWRIKIEALKIPSQKHITMMGLLEDKVKTKLWTAAGLPNDNLSIENAIIMFKSRRWPLMIDPQNQANKFIKKLGAEESEVGLDVMKTSNPNLLRNLELGIQTGKWVLIENVGQELDPALEPILLQQKTKSGGGWTLKLGDKVIAYDDNFKFFMTTTYPNPHYSPETSVKVTLLNFAITPFGLEEQMLNQFVLQEMPDLQKRKDMIVQQNAQAAKTLREIEDKILEGLTKNSEISLILEDDELINILADSKQTSDDINQRLIESEETEKEIDLTRESYRAVAFRASLLFFCIIDLAYIDPMYQYSLQWFSHLFGIAIDSSPKPEGVEQRSKALNDYFTLLLYENICRSLFENHKLQFSFLLTVKILFGDNLIDPLEWRYFLAGPTGDSEIPHNPTDWLGELEWAEVYKQVYGTRDLPAYKGLLEYFMKEHHQFKRIFDSKDPEVEPLPGEWDNKFNSFQKMIVLKAIRPDKISEAISNFIVEKIGEEFIIPPTFDLGKSFKDSSVTSPLIFVLSTGSDPVSDYLRFANEQNMMSKQQSISLGKGQDQKATRMIEEAASRGGWVLLMNCHLATSFMPKLEVIVENLDDSNHRDFRMWLTSMPNKEFPVSVLQNSVKMTLEPPKGLRSNLLRSYATFDERELNEATSKPEVYKKLLFAYCFFHAIVQDRRKFGPIGWNIAYDFTNEDLTVNLKQLRIFLEEYDEIPFKVLHFLGAIINYGGRVTDDKDERLINTILEVYINPNILEDTYKFSESGKYFAPPNGDLEDYIDYIKTLPLKPNPEVFGLHENAEITTAQNETRSILETILGIQPRAAAGIGKTRDDIIQELSEHIQQKTPPVFDLEAVGKQYPTEYTESMNTVLFQECVRYNKMLAIMHESLINIQKAIVGEVVMSEELERMSDSLFNNQVPYMWSEFGFLSLKPLGSWVQDMNDRIEFLNKWIDKGTPSVFWISGFFFPQAFFTGTLQNYARKHVIAVDQLDFEFNFMDQIHHKDLTEKPDDGCYIYGMYIEGCRWDYEKHMLEDSLPKLLYTDLPCIHFLPVANRKIPDEGFYHCPVYKVLSRRGTLSTTGHSTNFVLYLDIPTIKHQNEWVRAGVAAFLALRY